MEAVLPIVIMVLFAVFGLPWLFRLKRGYLERALQKHNDETRAGLVLEKAGMPPLKYWIRNRKGDCWGVVRHPSGTRQWVRLGGVLRGGDSPLTFFDV